MFVERIPNRSSLPAILLRESYRIVMATSADRIERSWRGAIAANIESEPCHRERPPAVTKLSVH